jgi:nitrate/TMAO reductase-like tetraheme cytochrome c subunit
MSLAFRVTALIALTGGAVALGAWIKGGAATDPATPAKPRFESSQQCAQCHRDVYDEWHGSHHQIAYLNPEVRALSEDFRNKDCQACHLPRPVAMTGYGQRVLPRQTQPDEGVSCLTCHLGKDGEILGRNGVPAAPCAPQASPELVAMDLCGSCHNQHQTTDQWRASDFAKRGQDCNSCHMPQVERKLADGSSTVARSRWP